nr:hypothetical protein Q903MT_gene3646 [Picea sitchensis]
MDMSRIFLTYSDAQHEIRTAAGINTTPDPPTSPAPYHNLVLSLSTYALLSNLHSTTVGN